MDNTLVALFERPDEAEHVRKELIDAGFAPNDVSVFTEVAPHSSTEELLNGFLALFGKETEPNSSSFLTVYAARNHLDRASRIIEQHHPKDVKWS
jgi:hypothetical protein